MKARLILAAAALLFASVKTTAQVQHVPNTAYRFNVGLGAGVIMPMADLTNRPITPAGKISIDYRLKEFITIGLEAQGGILESGVKNAEAQEGGRYPKSISYGLYSKNTFQAGNLNLKLYLGQFTKKAGGTADITNNIYAGIGAGVIRNNISDIVTRYPENKRAIPGIIKSSMDVVVPVNLGIDIDVARKLSVNVNYQHNFTMGEGLDGYDFGVSAVKDSYGFLSVGIKLGFGSIL